MYVYNLARIYLWLYIYIHIHVYIHTYLYIYIYISMCVYIYKYIYVYIYIYVSVYIHIYIYIYICIHIPEAVGRRAPGPIMSQSSGSAATCSEKRGYVRIVYMYVRIHIIYIYIYIHTFIHTYILYMHVIRIHTYMSRERLAPGQWLVPSCGSVSDLLWRAGASQLIWILLQRSPDL